MAAWGPRRSAAAIEILRQEATALRVGGLPWKDVAERLGVSGSYAHNLVNGRKTRERARRRVPPSDGGVRCWICGDSMRTLPRHLATAHGLTTKEYRTRFPGADLVNEDVRAIGRDRASDGGYSKHWTRARMISAIKSWNARHGEPPRVNEWLRPSRKQYFAGTPKVIRSYPTVPAVMTEFGSWNAAMAAAGLEPRRPGTGQKQKSHCRQGHPLSGENLRVHRDGERECRTCARARTRKFYAKSRG